ncbi:hypothetical protein [Deinococcus sp. Leaf326]|nr:hypothetical protein [Deinococcus sp. Leaf326]
MGSAQRHEEDGTGHIEAQAGEIVLAEVVFLSGREGQRMGQGKQGRSGG